MAPRMPLGGPAAPRRPFLVAIAKILQCRRLADSRASESMRSQACAHRLQIGVWWRAMRQSRAKAPCGPAAMCCRQWRRVRPGFRIRYKSCSVRQVYLRKACPAGQVLLEPRRPASISESDWPGTSASHSSTARLRSKHGRAMHALPGGHCTTEGDRPCIKGHQNCSVRQANRPLPFSAPAAPAAQDPPARTGCRPPCVGCHSAAACPT